MLASGLKLKAKNNVLSLVSDEGVIDDAISINDLTQNKQSFVLNKIRRLKKSPKMIKISQP